MTENTAQSSTRAAADITAEVKHAASDVAGEARKVAEHKLDAGKDFAVGRLGAVAQALRHTSDRLRTDDEHGLTDYVAKAASSVEDVSRYLETRTLAQLLGDVEGYARREPAVFLGGAFFLGLLGGRLLKSATPSTEPHGERHATTTGSPRRLEAGPPRLSPSPSPDASAQPKPSPNPGPSAGAGAKPAAVTGSPSALPAGNPSLPSTPSFGAGARPQASTPSRGTSSETNGGPASSGARG